MGKRIDLLKIARKDATAAIALRSSLLRYYSPKVLFLNEAIDDDIVEIDKVVREIRRVLSAEKKPDAYTKFFLHGFLASIGKVESEAEARYVRKGQLFQRSAARQIRGYRVVRRKGYCMTWESPIITPSGLGDLLAGFLTESGQRLCRTALHGHISQVVFILTLWGMVRFSPSVFRDWEDSDKFLVQCENNLAYWPRWRTVVQCLRRASPRLYKRFRADANRVRYFNISLRRS